MKYRPQIDGLRAIAIIFIILSHFSGLPFASGGVNIFFS
jgi:peptidoglycan/LPS O-acetylase OafA/YrhL